MTTNTNGSLAAILAAWRAVNNYTQEQATRRLGVTLATYSRWERQVAVPSGLARVQLERELGAVNWAEIEREFAAVTLQRQASKAATIGS
jgi:transcriptional regulator with XRE-family HTH domain